MSDQAERLQEAEVALLDEIYEETTTARTEGILYRTWRQKAIEMRAERDALQERLDDVLQTLDGQINEVTRLSADRDWERKADALHKRVEELEQSLKFIANCKHPSGCGSCTITARAALKGEAGAQNREKK